MWAISAVLLILSVSTTAQENRLLLANANCTVVYSLTRTADNFFVDEIAQLQSQIDQHNVVFIDLNNWRNAYPHIEITGRQRNQIRALFNLPKNLNQTVIFDKEGQLINRHIGSVTLVNALLDCQLQ
ncbi:hypothetical protein RS130_06365 [Paraglaciecola aquimarina]|uniref:DUF4174 domain-containing protein n=1 Tax=Paraglaciecola aquimarina TaxID=1235557 RepID=A0ABU3SUC2_9ALTE|nr:hypothetical protein [Paraglaciecola aquimarina]MDU0353599.1 hypothetical protein [Paraglaciecola aquimarina]